MLKKMKTYQFFFIAVMIVIWSAFSYKANANKYFEGDYHDSTVIDAIFEPNEQTDHVGTFTFPDSNVVIIKPIMKDVFTSFHSNGQEPLEVSLLISEQELQIEPSEMIVISKYVGIGAAFIAILCFMIMIFSRNKKETPEEKRQKLKARV
jgi:hypothetical protein